MANTTVTSTQQATPEILDPYFTGTGITGTGLLPKAQEIFGRDYATAYGDALAKQGLAGAGRIAGLTDNEVAAGQIIKNLKQPTQFTEGQAAYTTGIGALDTAKTAYQNDTDVSSNLFTSDQISKYMDPYTQNVVDAQKLEAVRDAQIQ